tara:strand:+ start:28065 stop:28466 length:402 start_codon:yes stop_codon:yes gene_type:complete
MAVENNNKATTPQRILNEQASLDRLAEDIPLANCMKSSKYNKSTKDLEALEQAVGNLKGFLFRFLAKLNLVEWLQWMNHACLNPLKETSARKLKSGMGIPSSSYSEESQTIDTKTRPDKKGTKPGRIKASKPR